MPANGRGLSTQQRHGEEEILIALAERFIEEQTSRGKVSVGVYIYSMFSYKYSLHSVPQSELFQLIAELTNSFSH